MAVVGKQVFAHLIRVARNQGGIGTDTGIRTASTSADSRIADAGARTVFRITGIGVITHACAETRRQQQTLRSSIDAFSLGSQGADKSPV